MNTLNLTIVGNLTADPELRFTPNGVAVVKFTVAHTPRTRTAAGDWADGEPTFLDCVGWRQLAENIAESLTRGHRVIVAGRVRTERWDDKETGKQRSRMVLDVDAIGPDLTWATANVNRMQRTTAAAPADDPWATASRTRPTSPAPAGAAQSTAGEPPF